MQNKLKPCPFCGNKDIGLLNSSSGCSVICEHCGAQSEYMDEIKLAIEAWNRRKNESK